MKRNAEIRTALLSEPWLELYVEDDDTDIDDVRSRFNAAQGVALRRLERDGVTVRRRVMKEHGILTTALVTEEVRDVQG